MTKLRQLWLLTALGSLAVLALGYFMVVAPKSSKAAAVRQEAQEQLAANRQLQSKIQMLNQQKKDLPRLQAEMEKFTTKIPGNPGLPALIRSLSDASDNAGVNLVAITPSPPEFAKSGTAAAPTATAAGALAQIPVTIEVRGNYSQVTQFFNEVEGMPRAFLLTGAKIEPYNGDNKALGIEPDALSAELSGRLFMTAKAKAATPVTPVTADADVTK
jgi:Tfp pilus assembly protein PilO